MIVVVVMVAGYRVVETDADQPDFQPKSRFWPYVHLGGRCIHHSWIQRGTTAGVGAVPQSQVPAPYRPGLIHRRLVHPGPGPGPGPAPYTGTVSTPHIPPHTHHMPPGPLSVPCRITAAAALRHPYFADIGPLLEHPPQL